MHTVFNSLFNKVNVNSVKCVSITLQSSLRVRSINIWLLIAVFPCTRTDACCDQTGIPRTRSDIYCDRTDVF